MAQDEVQPVLRHESHGEEVSGDINVRHCCECWKYTDDMRRQGDLCHEAVAMLVNATPSIEQTDAYKAADAFLSAHFKRHTPLAAPRF
jgi:hypothetical protein